MGVNNRSTASNLNKKIQDLPPTPTIGTATAGVGQVSTTFTADSSGRGGPTGSYIAKASPGGATNTGASSPIVITGLDANTAYTVQVASVYTLTGTSEYSAASNSVTTPDVFTVNYLVIAGGGGGSRPGNTGTASGGGGAGGYRTSYGTTGGGGAAETGISVVKNTNYTVTIGGGGAGTSGQSQDGSPGTNSVFSTVTSTGGGQGANSTGGSGGSGGGNGGTRTPSPVQGNNGGNSNGSPDGAAGGGGGAGGAGVNGGATGYAQGGTGGAGLASSITGTSVTRASGGGGTGYYANGANGSGTRSDNTGYGGQAPGQHNNGSPGGSGVVILRYPTSAGTITIGAGLTGSTATDGSDKVTTITAGTGNVSWA